MATEKRYGASWHQAKADIGEAAWKKMAAGNSWLWLAGGRQLRGDVGARRCAISISISAVASTKS